MHQTILFLFYFIFLLMGKVDFLGEKNFFFEVLVDGLNIIQFSQSKNEGNPKLLVLFSDIWVLWGFSQPDRVKQIKRHCSFPGKKN